MTDYLPRAYVDFRRTCPEVNEALDRLGGAVDAAGPLDARTARLVKLGIAIGALAEGAFRSNVRKSLEAGSSPQEIRQVALGAITAVGFPAAVAALGWIDEVPEAGQGNPLSEHGPHVVRPCVYRAAGTSGLPRHPLTGPTLRSV